MSMTKEERDEARKRCNAATEGPWYADTYSLAIRDSFVVKTAANIEGHSGIFDADERKSDAGFAAHARTDLPRALDDLDSKDAEIERLQNTIHQIISAIDDMASETEGALQRPTERACIAEHIQDLIEDVMEDGQ